MFPDRTGFSSLLGHGQTLFGVAKDGFDLGAGHAGEPLEKVVDARAVLEIGEQCLDRNARSAENPGAADGSGVLLDRGTAAPIKHEIG